MFILGGVDSVYNKIFTQNPIQDGWVLYTDCDCPDGMQYVNDTKKKKKNANYSLIAEINNPKVVYNPQIQNGNWLYRHARSGLRKWRPMAEK